MVENIDSYMGGKGFSPMTHAIFINDESKVKSLLEAGEAELINTKDGRGCTALIAATSAPSPSGQVQLRTI